MLEQFQKRNCIPLYNIIKLNKTMPVIVLKPMNILRPFLIRCFFSYVGPLALYHIRLDHLYEPNNVFDPM